MKKNVLKLGLLCASVLMASCNGGNEPKTLKAKFKNYFPIGATLNYTGVKNDVFYDIIDEFSSMTCENEMKWGSLHTYDSVTKKHTYSYAKADEMVDYAQKHKMKIRGHALVWHQGLGNDEGTTSWVFKDENDETKLATKEVVLQRMRDHIREVMTHFKDDVYCWDVVNEAIDDNNASPMNENKTNVYRGSDWYETCGPDFIFEAFKTADEVRKELGIDVKLYYNDYENDNPVKLEKTVEMIKEMQKRGIAIDGIGLQCHYSVGNFNMDNLKNALETYAALGIDVQITELDISLYTLNSAMDKDPSLWIEYDSDDYYYYTDIQATIYGRISKICREFVDNEYPESYGDFTGLTFWGVADEDTWLSKYSDYRLNRVDYPLLFDALTREKKLSYEMFTDF